MQSPVRRRVWGGRNGLSRTITTIGMLIPGSLVTIPAAADANPLASPITVPLPCPDPSQLVGSWALVDLLPHCAATTNMLIALNALWVFGENGVLTRSSAPQGIRRGGFEVRCPTGDAMAPQLVIRRDVSAGAGGELEQRAIEALYPLALVERDESAWLYVEVASPCSSLVYVFQRRVYL